MRHEKQHWVLDATCPFCEKPITTARWFGKHRGIYCDTRKPDPKEIALCMRCVALALCAMTTTLHGDIAGSHPSSKHSGHAQRVEAHTAKHAPSISDKPSWKMGAA